MFYVVLIYGLFILIGGIMGHRSGSTASLVMGTFFGALLIIASLGMFKRRKWGVYGALILTLILDGFFTYRYFLSLKFMPPGMLAVVSLGVMILLIAHLRKNSKNYLS